MLEDKFTTTFSVLRQQWGTEVVGMDTVDVAAEAAVGSFAGYRQQATAEYVQSLGLQMTKPHFIWCPVDANVAEGDTLSSSYGIDRVRGIQVNRDGRNAHKQLLVEHIGAALETS